MRAQSEKIRIFIAYAGLSVLAHLLLLLSMGRFGSYHFSAPVNLLQAVLVDAAKPPGDAAPVAGSNGGKAGRGGDVGEDTADGGNHARVSDGEAAAPPAIREKSLEEPKEAEPVANREETADTGGRAAQPVPQPAAPQQNASAPAIPPPLRTAGEFMSAQDEKLSYLITLLGVPVGTMDLEAKNENGEVRITLRTRTNAALSSVYPVDDVMETRLMAGNFVVTRIRQQEGTFRSDIGFTLFLRDKRVFWVDRMRNRYSDETIPDSSVLDTLSSFYYLRNRPLPVGTTETLHIYDGDTYAPVPVEIVRREEIRLRNFKKVDCLLLRHVKQKEIFRRTGDLSIWLTNDGNKVPVKVETDSPVGKVTVELVSAETTPLKEGAEEKQFPPRSYSGKNNSP